MFAPSTTRIDGLTPAKYGILIIAVTFDCAAAAATNSRADSGRTSAQTVAKVAQPDVMMPVFGSCVSAMLWITTRCRSLPAPISDPETLAILAQQISHTERQLSQRTCVHSLTVGEIVRNVKMHCLPDRLGHFFRRRIRRRIADRVAHAHRVRIDPRGRPGHIIGRHQYWCAGVVAEPIL